VISDASPRWYVLVFMFETHLDHHRAVVRAYNAVEAAAQQPYTVASGACLVGVEPFEPDVNPEHKGLHAPWGRL